MCLFIAKKKARIASKDITVYKIVKLVPDLESFKCIEGDFHLKFHMLSEFHNFEYKLNREYKTKMKLKRIPTCYKYKDRYDFEVNSGFHSWSKPRNELHMLESEKYKYVLVECIIPKGSEYYVGKHSLGGSKGRVSNKIIIKSILWEITERSQVIL